MDNFEWLTDLLQISYYPPLCSLDGRFLFLDKHVQKESLVKLCKV